MTEKIFYFGLLISMIVFRLILLSEKLPHERERS